MHVSLSFVKMIFYVSHVFYANFPTDEGTLDFRNIFFPFYTWVLLCFVYHEVALNVNLFVINVAKCKQSSILTSKKELNRFITLIAKKNQQKQKKNVSGNWPMGNVFF
jgi:hypothetical protein